MKTGGNPHFAILIVAIIGAMAVLCIMYNAYKNAFPIAGGSAAYYDALQ